MWRGADTLSFMRAHMTRPPHGGVSRADDWFSTSLRTVKVVWLRINITVSEMGEKESMYPRGCVRLSVYLVWQ